MAKCPFIDPNFDIEIDEPCPVCGMLGTWCDDASKCVGNFVDTGDELHQVLGDALNGDVGGIFDEMVPNSGSDNDCA